MPHAQLAAYGESCGRIVTFGFYSESAVSARSHFERAHSKIQLVTRSQILTTPSVVFIPPRTYIRRASG
jgi:hypothetical protein